MKLLPKELSFSETGYSGSARRFLKSGIFRPAISPYDKLRRSPIKHLLAENLEEKPNCYIILPSTALLLYHRPKILHIYILPLVSFHLVVNKTTFLLQQHPTNTKTHFRGSASNTAEANRNFPLNLSTHSSWSGSH